MEDKVLIILRGLPGSGKSFTAELLSENGKYPICTADDFFITNGEYKFDFNKIAEAHNYCQTKANLKMASKCEKVIIANTSTTEREIEPYLEMAKLHGYKVISLVVENRHGNNNIHNVPPMTLEKMKNRFEIKL